MERKTPLYEEHLKLGGKMVTFAGYTLPVQYRTGVIAEHTAVRSACGLFDISHMGEILCEGPEALHSLNRLMTNDFSGMSAGQARYSPMCREDGGVLDDLIVYYFGEERYFIIVNAANREKDFQWMKEHESGGVVFTDLSDEKSLIALQGPKAAEIAAKLTDPEQIPEKYYSCRPEADVGGMKAVLSRTGYTGEDGFEFCVDNADAVRLWNLLLESGQEEGLIPCGLGARDTLRLEAGMPLYGHEMNEDMTPVEAGLGRYVKFDKTDFIGKKAMEEKGEPSVRRVGLAVTGRGVLRENEDVYADGGKIGRTTSGTYCPTLKRSAAMASVDRGSAAVGTKVQVDVRGRMVDAEIVKLPFYRRKP